MMVIRIITLMCSVATCFTCDMVKTIQFICIYDVIVCLNTEKNVLGYTDIQILKCLKLLQDQLTVNLISQE